MPSSSARRFAAAAATVALFAAIALPGDRPGLGMALVALGVAAALLVLCQSAPTRWGGAVGVAAAALAAACALRDAAWLVALDLVAAGALGSLAASGERSWLGIVRGAGALVARLPAGPLFVVWASGLRLRPRRLRPALPAARGLALGLALALVFGGLFASADRAFAQLTGEVLTPDVDLGLLPARVGAFLVAGAVAGGLALVALAGPRATRPRREEGRHRGEWVVALLVLDGLFAVFVAVQVHVLFGGHDHVLETAGLTYAEYARQGFGQLLAVSALTLGVVAAAARSEVSHGGRPTAGDLLLGLLCLLTLAVIVSALRRLGLYEDAFGFTVLRVTAQAIALWIGALLVAVLVVGSLRRRSLLPRTAAGVTAAALLALTLVNPEGLVAERNVERLRETGRIDLPYLAGLSADAVPALARLDPRRANCVLGAPAAELAGDDGAFALNASRERARQELKRIRFAQGRC